MNQESATGCDAQVGTKLERGQLRAVMLAEQSLRVRLAGVIIRRLSENGHSGSLPRWGVAAVSMWRLLLMRVRFCWGHAALQFVGLISLLLFSACSADPVATATPTKTPEPMQKAKTAVTPTMAPTASLQPPSPTPEPTGTPSSTARPEGLIGPDSYDAGVNPLTGEVMADPAVLDRRPVAVKVSNSPAQFVRPQSGLDKADLVFEHYAEGGVTRLTAIFYGQATGQAGSVRSGRLIDLEIPAMYQAAFAYSGSSGRVREMIRDSDFFDRVISPDFAYGEPYFYRVPREGVPYEHTLFADLYDIWAGSTAKATTPGRS